MTTFRELLTQVSQVSQVASDEIKESTKDIDEMIEDIEGLKGKGAQVAWDFMENLSHSLRLYPGDSTPQDYLDKMSDQQIKTLHKQIEKYL